MKLSIRWEISASLNTTLLAFTNHQMWEFLLGRREWFIQFADGKYTDLCWMI